MSEDEMTHPSVMSEDELLEDAQRSENSRIAASIEPYHKVIAERDALTAKLAASEREREALKKAHDLLNAGFESATEQMHELKQTVRSLEAKFAASEAACAAYRLTLNKIACGNEPWERDEMIDAACSAITSTDAGLGWHSPQDWEAVQAKMASMRLAMGVVSNREVVGMTEEEKSAWYAALSTDAGQHVLDYIAAARRLNDVARKTAKERGWMGDLREAVADVDAADAKLQGGTA